MWYTLHYYTITLQSLPIGFYTSYLMCHIKNSPPCLHLALTFFILIAFLSLECLATTFLHHYLKITIFHHVYHVFTEEKLVKWNYFSHHISWLLLVWIFLNSISFLCHNPNKMNLNIYMLCPLIMLWAFEQIYYPLVIMVYYHSTLEKELSIDWEARYQVSGLIRITKLTRCWHNKVVPYRTTVPS